MPLKLYLKSKFSFSYEHTRWHLNKKQGRGLYFLPHIELDLPSNWVWQPGNNRINTRSCGMVGASVIPTKVESDKKLISPTLPSHQSQCPATVCDLVPWSPKKGVACSVFETEINTKDACLAFQVWFHISHLSSCPQNHLSVALFLIPFGWLLRWSLIWDVCLM